MVHIGIDLGTTNSLIAVFEDDGPKLVENVLGKYLTPSVVSLDNKKLITGDLAKSRLITHPNHTASVFKRTLGAEKTYQIGSRIFTSAELSAVILRSLKSDAEVYLGHEINDVVVSVPAYFNELQRKAVSAACLMADLNALRLINEPSAAALTYGLQNLDVESTILVFDLGGGTFDVSILEIFEGVMEVKATAGDAYLGGEDFTNKLTNFLTDKLEKKPAKNDKAAIRLLAEEVKLGLSHKHEVSLNATVGGKPLNTNITRSDFDEICADLLARLRRPVERCLYDAKLAASEIDQVVLAGGATRMPIIRSLVAKQFKKLPETRINPDHVVALGAAVQSGLVGRNEALDDVVMTDVSAFTLGIETATMVGDQIQAGYFLPIIERNSVVPISMESLISTAQIGQEVVDVGIYQGEAPVVESNLLLGTLQVRVPRNRKDHEYIAVRLTYDVSGLLEVDVTVLSTGKTSNLLIKKLAGEISEKDILATRKLLEQLKTHPREAIENKLLRSRLEKCYAMANMGDRREIHEMLVQFDAAINTQILSDIASITEHIQEALDRFESNYVR